MDDQDCDSPPESSPQYLYSVYSKLSRTPGGHWQQQTHMHARLPPAAARRQRLHRMYNWRAGRPSQPGGGCVGPERVGHGRWLGACTVAGESPLARAGTLAVRGGGGGTLRVGQLRPRGGSSRATARPPPPPLRYTPGPKVTPRDTESQGCTGPGLHGEMETGCMLCLHAAGCMAARGEPSRVARGCMHVWGAAWGPCGRRHGSPRGDWGSHVGSRGGGAVGPQRREWGPAGACE